ncbi:MAG: PEP-utilizing enzyme [Patescibacteria group bacterium]
MHQESMPVTTICEGLKKIKPEDYIRLFEFRNYPFIYDSLWLSYYQDKHTVCINVDQLRTAYMPKDHFVQSLREGRNLFESSTKIERYRKEFSSVEKEFLELAQALPSDFSLLPKLKPLACEWFRLYSFTDFHCTDGAQEELQKNFPDFGHFKDHKRETINRIAVGEESYLMCFFRSYAEHIHISFDDILLHTVDELVNMEIHDVSKRRDSVMSVVDKMCCIIDGADARMIAKRFRSIALGRGTVASKGCITGQAFVFHNDIMYLNQIVQLAETMKAGDVLICETTSPDLAPLFTKAGAIIANQGGIMSHAAIISREMGIPCIVGMENATRYFRTGNLVEVDANKGVVRVIKRAQEQQST